MYKTCTVSWENGDTVNHRGFLGYPIFNQTHVRQSMIITPSNTVPNTVGMPCAWWLQVSATNKSVILDTMIIQIEAAIGILYIPSSKQKHGYGTSTMWFFRWFSQLEASIYRIATCDPVETTAWCNLKLAGLWQSHKLKGKKPNNGECNPKQWAPQPLNSSPPNNNTYQNVIYG